MRKANLACHITRCQNENRDKTFRSSLCPGTFYEKIVFEQHINEMHVRETTYSNQDPAIGFLQLSGLVEFNVRVERWAAVRVQYSHSVHAFTQTLKHNSAVFAPHLYASARRMFHLLCLAHP